MLDIEVSVEPTDTVLDIVSLAEMKAHLRISPTMTALDSVITEALEETLEEIDGRAGILNRTVLPTTYIRYMSDFPQPQPWRGSRAQTTRLAGVTPWGDQDLNPPILFPYPPLISVENISVGTTTVDPATYVVMAGKLVGEVKLVPDASWPDVTPGPRAVSVTFTAGYETYPKNIKRLIKILAADHIENPEATINETRVLLINRKTAYGADYLTNLLRIPVDYADWNE